jgi:hypothetical protein
MKLSQVTRLGFCSGALVTLSTVLLLSGPRIPAAKPMAAIRQHAPIRIHQRRDNQQYDSYNWAGYAVTGATGSVTDVKGSWVVPTVNCTTTPTGYSSFWLGIDGFSSTTVEQTGTDSDCVSFSGQTGTPNYYAWFEFYPNPSYVIEFSNGIRPGDMMTAEVKFAGQSSSSGRRGSGSLFTATITDVTQNETYTITSTVSGASQSSAEWIAEAPCCGRGGSILPLADFSVIGFNSGTSTVQNTTGAIGSFGSNVQEITMVDETGSHSLKAQPSGVSGGGFTVTWLNPGP